jgi:hypothetical protein
MTVLYLCDSIQGVFNELAKNGGGGLILQDYLLPPSLRLANFADPCVSEFLQGAFDMAENSMVDGRVGRTGYLFSQVLAEITLEAEYDGMIVPGVRGNRDLRYRNVVVFNPLDKWTAWSCQDAGFRFVKAKRLSSTTYSQQHARECAYALRVIPDVRSIDDHHGIQAT